MVTMRNTHFSPPFPERKYPWVENNAIQGIFPYLTYRAHQFFFQIAESRLGSAGLSLGRGHSFCETGDCHWKEAVVAQSYRRFGVDRSEPAASHDALSRSYQFLLLALLELSTSLLSCLIVHRPKGSHKPLACDYIP